MLLQPLKIHVSGANELSGLALPLVNELSGFSGFLEAKPNSISRTIGSFATSFVFDKFAVFIEYRQGFAFVDFNISGG
jgi:hypothetical protein